MNCVYCGGATKVTNSRHQKQLNAVWRRRQCLQCHQIFTTNESADFARSWRFYDQHGQLQPFMPEKLLISLYKRLEHRPTALEDAAALAATIQAKLRQTIRAGIIPREQVIQTALATLQHFDHAAATSYQAFHKL